jgi:hypothetical protein
VKIVKFIGSFLGGHPHNWNKLCIACLTEIDNLNQKIQEENWKVFANVPVRQTEKPTSVTFGKILYFQVPF